MTARLIVIAATSAVYSLLDVLNLQLLRALEFTPMAHWVYMPSGLRLVFVLVFVSSGAIGVALGASLVGWLHYFEGDPVTAMLIGVCSGAAPYLARYACRDWLGMDLELHNLTPRKLMAMATVFAGISAVFQQTALVWRGYTDTFLLSTAAMAVGDLLGTVIVIYLIKLILLAIGWGLRSR